MDWRLLLHNIGFSASTIVALFMAVFVYLRNRKAEANITFALGFVSIAFFTGSHVIGVNIADPYLSRDVLMWNISVIFITCFIAHCSFSIAGAVKKQRLFLIGMYTSAFFLTVLYILFPNTYLLPSVPKMYFLNYYVAGSLQWIMRIIFDVIVPTYFLSYLVYAYRKADLLMRNRLKYFFVSLGLGYSIGSIAIFLVYDISVDPLYASLCVPILAIPMAYAILQYNLMDIRVVTKRALLVATIIAFLSFGIFFIGYLNSFISNQVSNFPQWLLPLISACIATGVGIFVWNKFKEIEILKYEFITVVTHKLRTPLTSIKWSADNLLSIVLPSDKQVDVIRIKDSVNRLVELTDVLAGISLNDSENYLYNYKTVDLADLCKSIMGEYLKQAELKNISLTMKNLTDKSLPVKIDLVKIRILLQILIDNSLTYTNNGGKVSFSLSKEKSNAVISIVDNGIGLSKDEIHLIFSRFYRTETSRKSNTEGMGIGLSIAKNIVKRHDGKIWVESDGIGKGTTFFVSLPIKN